MIELVEVDKRVDLILETADYEFLYRLVKEELKNIGEKPFRAEQIFKWIYIDKVSSFDDMTNLSLDLRKKLSEIYEFKEFGIVHKLVSKDGTKKYLFDVKDENNNLIETVLMKRKSE